MKGMLLVVLFLFGFMGLRGQQSDFIVLKKRNNRTLKTYSPGIFLLAATGSGFVLNGYIQDIRNDSVFVLQQETRLQAKEFGTELDTIRYLIGVPYQNIAHYYFGGRRIWGGRRKEFSNNFLPTIMMIGGTGFVVLELVNTAYRRESVTKDNKAGALGIAAGVAMAGLLWKTINRQSRVANGLKYKVIYVHGSKQ